MRDIIDPFCK